MTQFLPPNLLALFAARDPIPYLPPVGRLPHEKHTTGYSGVGQYVQFFEETPAPPKAKVETREERLERRRREKQEKMTYKLEKEIAVWDPNANERATTDPFKTLFIGRVNFDTTETKLRREFESYGPVKKIIVAKDKKTGKPRGYAFVEYEHERDMHSAFKHADGKKIDGKRVLVDVERGRTVKGWLPRRLGGGLGGTRRGGPEVNVKISGREDQDRERFRDDAKRDRHEDRRDRRERRDRDKSNDHEDRRRDRSRDKHRDKDRDRKKSKDRDKDKDRSERKRSRSKTRKDKDRSDRKRSRDRDRDKGDKDKDRKRRREEKEKERAERKDKVKSDPDVDTVRIKEEPVDDYQSYDNYDDYDPNHIKSEF